MTLLLRQAGLLCILRDNVDVPNLANAAAILYISFLPELEAQRKLALSRGNRQDFRGTRRA